MDTSSSEKQKIKRWVISAWKEALPMYSKENTYTLTKRNGPLLLSISVTPSDSGYYLPTVYVQTLLTGAEHRSLVFLKCLQSPGWFDEGNIYFDQFSGRLAYASAKDSLKKQFLNLNGNLPYL